MSEQNSNPTEMYFSRMARCLSNLADNKDFKELIEVGYLEENAVRLTSLLAEPEAKNKENIMEQLKAISYLRQFFITCERMAEMQADVDEEESLPKPVL